MDKEDGFVVCEDGTPCGRAVDVTPPVHAVSSTTRGVAWGTCMAFAAVRPGAAADVSINASDVHGVSSSQPADRAAAHRHTATMTALLTALDTQSPSPAFIIPSTAQQLSYPALCSQIRALQSKLAALGVAPKTAVTLSLPNTVEFAVAFLAVSAQRAVAAPLNPAYKQEEVEFYVDDIKAVLSLVPRGAVRTGEAAVAAARKFGVGIAEVWFDKEEGVRLELVERGSYLKSKQKTYEAQADDVAVLLHLPPTFVFRT